jgi:hypothetical protein
MALWCPLNVGRRIPHRPGPRCARRSSSNSSTGSPGRRLHYMKPIAATHGRSDRHRHVRARLRGTAATGTQASMPGCSFCRLCGFALRPDYDTPNRSHTSIGNRWALFSASLAVDSHGGLTKVARDRAQPHFPTCNHETPDYPGRSRSRSCTHELAAGWEAHCNSRCQPRPMVRST